MAQRLSSLKPANKRMHWSRRPGRIHMGSRHRRPSDAGRYAVDHFTPQPDATAVIYDRRALLLAYAESLNARNAEVSLDAQKRSAALQAAFGVSFKLPKMPRHPGPEDLRRFVLLELFNRVAKSYSTLEHPLSGYQECSLTLNTLRNCGLRGNRVYDRLVDLGANNADRRPLVLTMLDDLFTLVFGDRVDENSTVELSNESSGTA